MCRSVPQMATESTLQSTSSGPGFGTGTSWRISWRLGSVRTTARIVVGNGWLCASAGTVVVVLTSVCTLPRESAAAATYHLRRIRRGSDMVVGSESQTTFASLLRTSRLRAGLTQAALAEQ